MTTPEIIPTDDEMQLIVEKIEAHPDIDPDEFLSTNEQMAMCGYVWDGLCRKFREEGKTEEEIILFLFDKMPGEWTISPVYVEETGKIIGFDLVFPNVQ